MSSVNRKILYDKLMAEKKFKEAADTILHHPEMAEKIEEKPKEIKTRGKK